MKSILLVALGGSVGAVLRYVVSLVLNNQTSFPLNTFLVNALGCFLIGLFYSNLAEGSNSMNIKSFLIIGVLGGFTTYSSFAFEAMVLLKNQLFKQAMLYVLLSNVVCIGFAYLGFLIKK